MVRTAASLRIVDMASALEGIETKRNVTVTIDLSPRVGLAESPAEIPSGGCPALPARPFNSDRRPRCLVRMGTSEYPCHALLCLRDALLRRPI